MISRIIYFGLMIAAIYILLSGGGKMIIDGLSVAWNSLWSGIGGAQQQTVQPVPSNPVLKRLPVK